MNVRDLTKKYPELKKILDTVCIVDVGNTFVKTNEGYSIPSTVTEVEKFVDTTDGTSSNVEWNGKKYIVGSIKGELNMDPAKYKSDHYKLCLLNAIILHFEGKQNIKVRLGLGLPAKYYDEHHTEMRNEIKALDKQTIVVDETTYTIEIVDVHVFKQGGTLSTSNISDFKYPLMILDFGGGTLDISYWEYTKNKKRQNVLKMTDARSFSEFGFEVVMSEFATRINALPGSDGKTDVHDVINYLEMNSMKFGNDNTLQELRDAIFAPYTKKAYSKIATELKPNSCEDVRLIGGPAKEVLPYIKPLFDNCEVQLMDEENFQSMNAVLFYNRYAELLAVDFIETNKEVAATELK